MRSLPVFFLIVLLASCSSGPAIQPDADDGGLVLPGGFRALVVADSVGPARHLAVRDNGDIYVKLRITDERPGNIALRDTTGDGRADVQRAFGDYPNDGTFATEMRIRNDYLYYSSEQVVYRQKLRDGDWIPSGKPEVILVDHHPRQWHNAKSLAFDQDGGMYVTFSAPTNVCEDWTNHRSNGSAYIQGEQPCLQLRDQAAIWRFDADRPGQTQRDGKPFATGLRSVVGLAWNDTDNSLYAVQHGRDYLYNHAPHLYTPWQNAVLPAEEFMKVSEGDDFGWPYSYYDGFRKKRMVAPEYGGDGQRGPDQFDFADPLLGLPAHWAPNDLLFYKGDQFPKRYRHGAFVAFHGSTNRAPYPQGGYVVAFIPFAEGKPTGEWEVFADGFTGVDTVKQMADARHRPVGLSEGADGSLYIIESNRGRIWRVLFTGERASFGTAELAGMESRKNRSHLKVPDAVADDLTRRQKPDGKLLYAMYCVSCHQENGEGEDPMHPPLAGSEWVTGDRETLIRILVQGQQEEITVKGKSYGHIMPAFGFLSDGQLAAIASYIRTGFGNKAGAVTAEDLADVRSKGQ